MQLGAGWKDRGGDFRPAQWAKQGSVCVLSGSIEKQGEFNATLAILPQQCRPKADSVFTINHNEKVARVDVS